MTQYHSEIIQKIKKSLTPDLLKGMWKKSANSGCSCAGHCYVATESLYWILGGKESKYKPCVLSDKKGITHWYLMNLEDNTVLDPTVEQFYGKEVPYEKGKPNGMMNHPIGGSKRAKIVIDRVNNIK